MPTYYDETLEDRYSRENQEHLSALARMKPEQIQHMEISLNNALSDVDMLRKDVARLVEALELISDTDPDEGTAWFHEIAYKALSTCRKGGELMGATSGQFELYFVANVNNGELTHLVAGPFIDSEDAEEFIQENGHFLAMKVVAGKVEVEEKSK